MSEERPIIVDLVILICACGKERPFKQEPPLEGAKALIEWMNTKATACGCGATSCDVRARLVEDS